MSAKVEALCLMCRLRPFGDVSPEWKRLHDIIQDDLMDRPEPTAGTTINYPSRVGEWAQAFAPQPFRDSVPAWGWTFRNCTLTSADDREAPDLRWPVDPYRTPGHWKGRRAL